VKEFKSFNYPEAWVIQNIFPHLRREAIHNLGQTFISPIFPTVSFTMEIGVISQGLSGKGVTLSNHPISNAEVRESKAISLLPLCATWHFMGRLLPLPMS
jgi:hypothetical protein